MKKFFPASLYIILCFTICSCNNSNSSKPKTEEQQLDEVAKSKMTEKPAPPAPTVIPPAAELQEQIKAMEKELYSSEVLDKDKARQMIRLYDTYHKNYYKDFVCPDYLFKAGEISENINQYNRAADFYRMCCFEYNDNYKLRAECMFRLANVYDYKLNDYVHAKEIYRQITEQYPKTQLAKDAAESIKMMGRSDADIIRAFEAKNKTVK